MSYPSRKKVIKIWGLIDNTVSWNCRSVLKYLSNLIDNCFEENKNSIGNDIDVLLGTISDPIEDAEACQKLCQQRRECEYFVFAKDFYTATLQGHRDVCWLKSSKSSLISYNGFVFGPKKCSEEMPKKGYLHIISEFRLF